MKRNFLRSILLLVAVVVLPACAGPPFYSAKDIHGQIVDDDTGLPLEGVIIVAQWELRQSVLGYSGHKGMMVEIIEAVTDASGNYSIPSWGPRPRLPFNYLDNRDPKLSIFKSGYFPQELSNRLQSEEDANHSLRTSEWDGKVIRLKKFGGGSLEDYASQLRILISDGLAGDGRKLRSYPRMVLALDAEQRRLDALGLKPGYIFSAITIELLNEGDQKFLRKYK